MKVYCAWQHVERRGVVAEHALEEREGSRPADGETAHVGHVEQPGAAPGGQVLGHGARGVDEGHLPAGELHHLGAERHVAVVKRGL